MVAGDPEDGNIQIGQRLHLTRELLGPLPAQGLAVVIGSMLRCQAPDQVAEEAGELGTRIEPMHDPVHCREVFFVPTSKLGWTDTAVSIRHKVATLFAAGQQRL